MILQNKKRISYREKLNSELQSAVRQYIKDSGNDVSALRIGRFPLERFPMIVEQGMKVEVSNITVVENSSPLSQIYPYVAVVHAVVQKGDMKDDMYLDVGVAVGAEHVSKHFPNTVPLPA